MELEEKPLPGIGVRRELRTDRGGRLGVVVRRNGTRELVVYDRADPDACSSVVELSAGEAAALAALLAGEPSGPGGGDPAAR